MRIEYHARNLRKLSDTVLNISMLVASSGWRPINSTNSAHESRMATADSCWRLYELVWRDSSNTAVTTMSIASNQFSGLSTRSGRYHSSQRRLRRRAVLKNGECNVLQSKISNMNLRFLQDIFTTLVDVQWRWTLLVFSLSFFLSWLTFALIWWLIAFTHGDLEPEHLPERQEESKWSPCVDNIHDFGSCFLFSVETQHTIGYGGRATTEECPEAIFVMCLQSIVGVMIQAFMTGIVFAKLSRPKKRTQTLLFSRQAVICVRDGELCLMFRVGDMRKSHIEGETLAPFQHELTLSADDCGSDLFFIWPTVVVHKIDSSSPLWNMSAVDMMHEKFEIVAILEGTIETTSQTTQARSSYLPVEILWGHRFAPMVTYCRERHGYQVDYSLFHCTTPVDTPLCSAMDLAAFHRHHAGLPNAGGSDVVNAWMIRNEDPPARREKSGKTAFQKSIIAYGDVNGDVPRAGADIHNMMAVALPNAHNLVSL
ncbi:hypothetical protein FOCC_FOCC016877 [Frankliniella occidentalis]|nr:hypothetical protein FOCC_FOCC016877 [Frankliniella occidentalis]